MKHTKTIVLLLAAMIALVLSYYAGFHAGDGGNKSGSSSEVVTKTDDEIHHDEAIRWQTNGDGSRSVFIYNDDNQITLRRELDDRGKTMFVALYRLDSDGNPLSAKIYDSGGRMLYKVSYGYSKNSGLLVEQRIFGISDESGDNQSPVLRVIYPNKGQDQEVTPVILDRSGEVHPDALDGMPLSLIDHPLKDR